MNPTERSAARRSGRRSASRTGSSAPTAASWGDRRRTPGSRLVPPARGRAAADVGAGGGPAAVPSGARVLTSGSSEAGTRQWQQRHDDKNRVPRFVKNVLHRQGRNHPDPNLGGFEGEVAEGLAELRVDLQPPVDFLHGGEHLRRTTQTPRPRQESPQLLAHTPRVRNPVALGLAGRLTHVVQLPVPARRGTRPAPGRRGPAVPGAR